MLLCSHFRQGCPLKGNNKAGCRAPLEIRDVAIGTGPQQFMHTIIGGELQNPPMVLVPGCERLPLLVTLCSLLSGAFVAPRSCWMESAGFALAWGFLLPCWQASGKQSTHLGRECCQTYLCLSLDSDVCRVNFEVPS